MPRENLYRVPATPPQETELQLDSMLILLSIMLILLSFMLSMLTIMHIMLSMVPNEVNEL